MQEPPVASDQVARQPPDRYAGQPARVRPQQPLCPGHLPGCVQVRRGPAYGELLHGSPAGRGLGAVLEAPPLHQHRPQFVDGLLPRPHPDGTSSTPGAEPHTSSVSSRWKSIHSSSGSRSPSSSTASSSASTSSAGSRAHHDAGPQVAVARRRFLVPAGGEVGHGQWPPSGDLDAVPQPLPRLEPRGARRAQPPHHASSEGSGHCSSAPASRPAAVTACRRASPSRGAFTPPVGRAPAPAALPPRRARPSR